MQQMILNTSSSTFSPFFFNFDGEIICVYFPSTYRKIFSLFRKAIRFLFSSQRHRKKSNPSDFASQYHYSFCDNITQRFHYINIAAAQSVFKVLAYSEI